jgi:exodeoxyribonuclease-3
VSMKKKDTTKNIIDIEKIIDIFGIYFHNWWKSEAAWEGKLVFYTEFWKYMDELRSQWHEVLWWWDLNCAHHPIDLARPKENDGKIGFHPLERAWLDNRAQDGWHDIWRKKNPTTTDVYSWWDVITRSRSRNVWWRIDAWWGSDAISEVSQVTYLTQQLWSDHCPIVLDISI